MTDPTEVSMVEKVAEAIRDNIQASLSDDVTVDYGYAASAVLSAIRPFFAAELERAQRGSFGVGEWVDGNDSGQVWAWEQAIAMITAALSEEG